MRMVLKQLQVCLRGRIHWIWVRIQIQPHMPTCHQHQPAVASCSRFQGHCHVAARVGVATQSYSHEVRVWVGVGAATQSINSGPAWTGSRVALAVGAAAQGATARPCH